MIILHSPGKEMTELYEVQPKGLMQADSQFKVVFDAIRQLMNQSGKNKVITGFGRGKRE